MLTHIHTASEILALAIRVLKLSQRVLTRTTDRCTALETLALAFRVFKQRHRLQTQTTQTAVEVLAPSLDYGTTIGGEDHLQFRVMFQRTCLCEQDDATIKAIADKHGKTTSQVILAWHISRGTSAIPRSGSLQHQKVAFAPATF